MANHGCPIFAWHHLSPGKRVKGHPIRAMQRGYRRSLMGRTSTVTIRVILSRIARRRWQMRRIGPVSLLEESPSTSNKVDELELWVTTKEVCLQSILKLLTALRIINIRASPNKTSNHDWYNSWTPLQDPINFVVKNNAQSSAKGTKVPPSQSNSWWDKAYLSSVVCARSKEESTGHFYTDRHGSWCLILEVICINTNQCIERASQCWHCEGDENVNYGSRVSRPYPT